MVQTEENMKMRSLLDVMPAVLSKKVLMAQKILENVCKTTFEKKGEVLSALTHKLETLLPPN